MLHAHFKSEQELHFLISKSIVEVMIADLLLNPEDVEGCTHQNTLVSDIEQDKYLVTIKKLKMFSLVIGFIALGASFLYGN